MLDFDCINGKVLIELDKQSEFADGSDIIIKPEASREKPWAGRVMTFGKGHHDLKGKFHPVYDLYVGQRVLIQSYVGYTVPIKGNDNKCLMVEFSDVLCELPDDVRVGCL